MKIIVKMETIGRPGEVAPVLFFPDEPANPARVLCYSPRDGHTEASRAYMRALPTAQGVAQRNAAWMALAAYCRQHGVKQ